MAVPARVSLITLGVVDLNRSTDFYRALGWPLSSASVFDTVSFFRTGGAVLALWGRDDLAADAGVDAAATGGFRAVALAINLDTPEDVDAALRQAVAAGGRLVRSAHTADWGGYSGYFADPDGHLWEVAYNPFWPIWPRRAAHPALIQEILGEHQPKDQAPGQKHPSRRLISSVFEIKAPSDIP